MHVRIHTHQNEGWYGEVPIDPAGMTTTEVNEAILRFFDRVDEDDTERLRVLDYNLPSLGVGDMIVWEEGVFTVQPFGFTAETIETDCDFPHDLRHRQTGPLS